MTSTNSSNLRLYPRGSTPFGKSWEEWAATWSKWYLEQPVGTSPANDKSGKNSSQSQNNADVWFLAGTLRGSADRTCTIPAGKAILFPIVVKDCSFAEYPNLKTESDLRKCAAKDEIDSVGRNEVTVDGTELQNADKHRVQSTLFEFTFPENNVYGVKPGPTQAVSDGYWVFLEPLPPGDHEIYFVGEHPEKNGGTFKTEVKYHLTI
jgi:hypothetical protein